MGLFKKKKTEEPVEDSLSTYDRIVFEKLENDDDKYFMQLADQMIDGAPLIINFEPLDIDQANKALAFFSGVVYAIKGEIVHIQEKVFLFANKDVYKDGTMEGFLKEIVE